VLLFNLIVTPSNDIALLICNDNPSAVIIELTRHNLINGINGTALWVWKLKHVLSGYNTNLTGVEVSQNAEKEVVKGEDN